MAAPPCLTLTDLRLSFGGKPLFEGVTASLYRGERAALVGRNGVGKSTLMKIVAGAIDPDAGELWMQPGLTSAVVPQEPDLSTFDTVRDYICAGAVEIYRADAELDQFGLSPTAPTETLSGGQQRRAALAKAFAQEPDILLLDEPTNHLDIEMIAELEARLKAFRGLVLLVSHDRRFLENVTTTTLWLRNGQVAKSPKGYEDFEAWAEKIEAEEAKALSRLNTKLDDEKRWLARGVTGRRRRNQGRLAKLNALREQHARLRAEIGAAQAKTALSAELGEKQSKRLIDAVGLDKAFDTPNGPLKIARDVSVRVLRGDRLGVIGPNGAGKTTLLKLLLGELEPDAGKIRRSKTLDVTYLDQTRDSLKPGDTLWEALAPNGGDHIMVQGRSRHVAAYAKDFLFKPEQLRQPIAALSGGERNRLTLAIALARPSNCLVLDEPTNDLDLDTLEMLEEMLADYEGTLILVSHDRAFLDATVTSCLSPVGQGAWIQTPGGWSDAERQLAGRRKADTAPSAAKKKTTPQPEKPRKPSKLSYKDTHRLTELETLLPELTERIEALETELADPALFEANPHRFAAASKALEESRTALAEAEEDWLDIETRREALEAG